MPSRKVRNLSADPRCTVAVEDALDPVVLEGVAEVRRQEQDRRRFLIALNVKYDTDYGLDFLDGVSALCLRVRPIAAFGLRQQNFTGSPTRWTFRLRHGDRYSDRGRVGCSAATSRQPDSVTM